MEIQGETVTQECGIGEGGAACWADMHFEW